MGFEECPCENQVSFGVQFDLVLVNLGEKMDDTVESVVLVKKKKEVVDGFQSRSDAAFEQGLKTSGI